MLLAEIIVWLALAYLGAGLGVALPFVYRGVDLMDSAARESALGFRLLILPGSVALWPLIASKWARALRRGDQT